MEAGLSRQSSAGAGEGTELRRKVRVAVFGSFYRGYHVIQELLHHPEHEHIELVGIATDDPSQSWVSPGRRVWQYPHTPEEESMVAALADRLGVSCYRGRVKDPVFYELLEQVWRPDVCVMATFGQKINARIHQWPRLGFFNLHPCVDDGWPSKYVGGNPFQALLDDGQTYVRVALHRVDDGFDTGELIAYSDKVFIPPTAGVVDLHKATAPDAARLAARQVFDLVRAERTRPEVQAQS